MFFCLINVSGPITTQSAEVFGLVCLCFFFLLISQRLNGGKEQMAPSYTPSRMRQREAAVCSPGSSSLPKGPVEYSKLGLLSPKAVTVSCLPTLQLAALSWFE